MINPYTQAGQVADHIDAAKHRLRYSLTSMQGSDGLAVAELVEIEGRVIDLIGQCEALVAQLAEVK